jgi:hypothetical protein
MEKVIRTLLQRDINNITLFADNKGKNSKIFYAIFRKTKQFYRLSKKNSWIELHCPISNVPLACSLLWIARAMEKYAVDTTCLSCEEDNLELRKGVQHRIDHEN